VPEPPPGERGLRTLADRYVRAEASVLLRLGEAVTGDRREPTREALELLAALRGLDSRGPVFDAYLAAHPRGTRRAVADLAGSLAKKLDRAVVSASDAARQAFGRVTAENLQEVMEVALTAVVDERGTQWTMGRYAEMTTVTIGRVATSRGVANRAGPNGRVVIDAGECAFCQQFAGTYPAAGAPMPPFHPHCTCVASPA